MAIGVTGFLSSSSSKHGRFKERPSKLEIFNKRSLRLSGFCECPCSYSMCPKNAIMLGPTWYRTGIRSKASICHLSTRWGEVPLRHSAVEYGPAVDLQCHWNPMAIKSIIIIITITITTTISTSRYIMTYISRSEIVFCLASYKDHGPQASIKYPHFAWPVGGLCSSRNIYIYIYIHIYMLNLN